MTKHEFVTACLMHNIHPSIVDENEALQDALRNRDDAEVLRILEEEY